MKHLNPTRTVGAILLATSSMWLSVQDAHAIGFVPPPGQGTPSQATGGASRGNVKFAPAKGQGAPSQATGGASRGNFFQPPSGQGAPSQATGGASRGKLFKPAKGKGAPMRAAGGASRVGRYDLNATTNLSAAAGPSALIAMLPPTYSGTTVLARPTLMTYLPTSTANIAVFSLKDEDSNMLYQKNLAVSGEAGLMAIALPADMPALEVNKNYQWYVALKVDGELNPSTPYVDGWIQRIEPSAEVAQALQQPDLLKQAEVLGANGIWYDCVATLATVRNTQPKNTSLDGQWQELLGSVGLQDVSQVPMISAVAQ